MANHRIWAPDRFKYVKDASKDIGAMLVMFGGMVAYFHRRGWL